MKYLPIFFQIRGRHCLVVGGGEVASRKARLLIRAGAVVNIVAPDIDGELRDLALKSGGRELRSTYAANFLEGMSLVVAATDENTINAAVSRDCMDRNIPVNVVDNPSLCSFIMPAIVDRSPMVIAVSSGGDSPVLTRHIKTLIEKAVPKAFGKLAELAARYRDAVKKSFVDIDLRRRFWESTLDGPVAEKVLAGRDDEAEQLLQKKITEGAVEREGEVYLVGAGPGDPELLTLKALRLMQRAEVVLYDRLVSPPILDLLRKDAHMVYVGKRRAEHSVEQENINQMLLNYAREGKRVLRLKGGDPFIFGRGGEEIDLLAKEGIAFQVVPGITAASGCASYAGIPLTHRDYSQSVRFITGHVKNGVLDFRWREFVEDSQTLVFYMGLTGLAQICSKLIEHGKAATTPAALIEHGTCPDQRVIVGDLLSLPKLVEQKNVRAPTLLVIGGVVSLHQTLKWFGN